jgi:hypothetical protein
MNQARLLTLCRNNGKADSVGPTSALPSGRVIQLRGIRARQRPEDRMLQIGESASFRYANIRRRNRCDLRVCVHQEHRFQIRNEQPAILDQFGSTDHRKMEIGNNQTDGIGELREASQAPDSVGRANDFVPDTSKPCCRLPGKARLYIYK